LPPIIGKASRQDNLDAIHNGPQQNRRFGEMLARLKRRKLVNGAAASLVKVKVGTWHEPGNLK